MGASSLARHRPFIRYAEGHIPGSKYFTGALLPDTTSIALNLDVTSNGDLNNFHDFRVQVSRTAPLRTWLTCKEHALRKSPGTRGFVLHILHLVVSRDTFYPATTLNTDESSVGHANSIDHQLPMRVSPPVSGSLQQRMHVTFMNFTYMLRCRDPDTRGTLAWQ